MMKQVNIKIPFRMLVLMLGLFLSVGAFAQINVKGHVKDAQGEPVIGATVRVANTQTATVTDFDGNFVLKANQGADITVSYIGYQEATVKAAPTVEVTLQDDNAVLNEVVVIGYGQVKKSDLTGSVAALKPDTKNKGLVVNPQDMLAGKVAGVNITSNDGTPGGGAQIRIRGGSSLNASNDPLIVIDGVPIDNNGIKGVSNMLSTINPQDIESFNVLKGASATAIYGSRGSNGVIIITTKKGRKGQAPQVSYAGSLTISSKKSTLDVMDGNQYRSFINNLYGAKDADGKLITNADGQALDADGNVPVPVQYLGTANTDWQDLIFRTAVSHDHSVTVSGAYKNLPYRVSIGYTDQQGIVKGSDFQRVTASLNLNPSLLDDHLTMNLNAKGMYAHTKYADGGAVGAAASFDPTQDPYSYSSQYHRGLTGIDQTLKNFGGYFEWPDAGSSLNDSTWPWNIKNEATKNPLALLELNSESAYSRNFIGSADIDYKIHGFEDLRLHLTLGADIAKGRQHSDYPSASPSNIYYGSHGAEQILKRNFTLSAYAQYYKDFAKIHHFDIQGGYEWAHYWRSLNNDYVGYYPTTNNDTSLAGTERPHVPYAFKTDNYIVSFFGRANYSLLDRYLLTFTVRRDGTSRFKEHWATFPAAAFAWRVIDEPFMKGAKAMSDLKVRLEWGKTGQQDGVSDYGWIPTYSKNTGTNGYYPLINGDDGHLYRPDNYTPDLKWETTTTYNVGLDWGFMNQRLSGSIDYYYRKTTDLLNTAPGAALSGFINEFMQNVGSLKNQGIEANISWKPIQTRDLYWTIDYNVTYNKNEITDLTGVSDNGAPVETGIDAGGTGNKVQANQVGFAAGSYYVYQQVYDANGMPIENLVVDRNGDGIISEADKYLYKKPTPDVTMGLSSRIEYKNWDLGFSMRASFGNYVYNNIMTNANLSKSAIWAQSSYIANRPLDVLGRNWQTDELTAKLSDYYIQNASFLKMDNITLGYSFSDLFKSGSYRGLSGRVYGTVSNVFTITKYDGLDPEIPSGNDNNIYPRPISFIFGLNLNF